MTVSKYQKPETPEQGPATVAPVSVAADERQSSNNVCLFNPWDRHLSNDMKPQRTKFSF
jgi:hypothetical protein